MAGRDSNPGHPKTGGRLRLKPNRQVEIASQHELHDVNQRALHDIALNKEMKRNAPLTDEQKISMTLAPELKMEKQKPELKRAPIFHEDLKPRDMSKDQLMLIPHVPPFAPPDKGPSTIMQSRIRKYPYSKGQIVTTDEMKKPKISSVGIVPSRSSGELPGIKILLKGESTLQPPTVDEIEMASRAQEAPDVPRLDLDDADDGGDPTTSRSSLRQTAPVGMSVMVEDKPPKEVEQKQRKPAILAAVGTTSSVTMTQRPKPPPKPAVMHHHHALQAMTKQDFLDVQSSHSAAKSSRSIQSSLLSDELYLPDEAVYSKYDDVIAVIDTDTETAVGAADKEKKGDQQSAAVKSVKQLLEEAKRISSPGSEPLYQRNLKPQSAASNIDSAREGRKSGRKRSSRTERRKSAAKSAGKASARDGEAGDGPQKPAERSVDEIVANLKQQASSGIMSEADRKIQEIMERVMSRTGASALADTDDTASVGTPEMTAAASETADGMEPLASMISEDGDDQMEDVFDERQSGALSPDQVEDSAREVKVPELIPEEEEPADVEVLSTRTGRTGDTLPVTLDGSSEPATIPQVPPPLQEETTGQLKEDDDMDIDLDTHLNIQQAWQDLLAPQEATYEDLVSVVGEQIDFHTRGIPGPSTGQCIPVQSTSVSFLSTWAPTGVKVKTKDEKVEKTEPPTYSIHHFCKMTDEFQLPREFRNTGRKYHTPDMYSGVFPDQPYRFEPETLQTLEEEAAAEEEGSMTETDREQAQAAQRIVDEANQLVQDGSLEDWKLKAEKALSHIDMSITGKRLEPGTDESRVYWAPAPPKLEVAPAKVRQILFPQYQSEQVDEFGRLIITAPAEPESESEEEEEEESPEDIANREMKERILGRQHQSCEDLTLLMRMEIKREEMIHNKRLDGQTYRSLITPPPTPEEEPDPKATKDTARGAAARSPSREKPGPVPTGPSASPDSPEAKVDPASLRVLGPPDDSLFAPVYFPPPRRSRSMPRMLADLDDTLMVPLDFNQAMEELREQRQQMERAKRQRRIQEATDEIQAVEEEERKQQQMQVEEAPVHVDILRISHTPKKEDELTPAEKALLAGRNYVILPKRKKRGRSKRPIDLARLEAVEKFLAIPPTKLERQKSLPNVKRAVERELRVSATVRKRKVSLPNVMDFEDYKKERRFPKDSDEREWTRDIWNAWFDEVFPPTPTGSDDEDEDDVLNDGGVGDAESQQRDDKRRGKDALPDILSEDIDVIEPIADTEENAEIIAILKEEVEKLTKLIDSMTPPMAFDLARRGALYRKLGYLWKAAEDLNRAIKMEPMLLDAYWHRHLLYVLQDKKAAALEDLNYIMKHNKTHAGAYRSMAEIYRKQGDVTMAIVNYTQAIKMNPMDHDAYFQRAAMYEERGEKLLAHEDYSKCMKLMPTRTDAIMKHGMHYFHNENWLNAINDFTELLRVDPLNAQGRLYRGLAYAKMSQWSPAVEDLSAAVHLDPNNWQAFYHRGCILRKAHPKRALQDYSVSLAIHDGEDNIMSYLHRGILYNSLGRPEDAIPDFEAVLKLNKDIACAHVNLGLIFMTKHLNYHRAIKKFTSAIKCDPTYVRAYVCRGEAYHKIHELKLALKDYTRAIHLRPDVHHYYMYRGQLVLELGNLDLAAFCVRHASEIGQGGAVSAFGDRPTQQAAVQSFLKNYDKAIDALTQATRVKPVTPLFMLLGKTQMKAKMFKEGAASFEKALELMRPWRQRDPWPPEAAEAHFLSGMCHMELRSYLPAFNAFNNAINLDGNYAEAYYQRGLARMKLKQSKGIQDFNRALAINPNIFQAYLSRACYYGLKGVYTKAILNCNEALKLQPNSVRAYLYRGALKYHIKAFELAIRDLTKAATIDNTCPLPYFNRAVCYQENKEYSKALTDYGIVLLLGDQLSLKVLINRGLLYFELGDYINALYDFQNAAKLSPVDHRIHHTLGLCFHKLGRLREAVATFKQCLQLKPFFLDGLIARGNVYMDYGHEKGILQARRDYERALRLDPMCLSARVNLAYTLQVCGKMMQAWRNFTIAITMKGNFKPALEGRAIVNLQMSNTFAAFQDISTSIHIGPTAELLTNRGVINQFMNDRVNAMRDYQRAIELDPKYALAYFNAANVYFHTRHFRQALDYYNKAIEHNPKDESALLNRAITKVLLHESKPALEDFRAALKLSPHSAHIYFNRGNLYSAMGLHDKAEKDYTKALSLQPDDPLTLKRRADIRGKLGRQEEAIQDYRRAIDIQTRPHRVLPAQ